MWLDNDNKEEALDVLKALGVTESRLKYMKYYDGGIGWMHKFEHHLGGRDGWSCLHIAKGPDFDDNDEIEGLDENDLEEWRNDHVIFVNGIEYHIYEGD